MEDRPVKLGLGLFFVALVLIGVPATMPFSPLNTLDEGTGMYELTRENTMRTESPTTIVAYQDLDPAVQAVVDRAITEGVAREPTANLPVGDNGLPFGSPGDPAVVGVQYNGEYYEFKTRLTTAGTQTGVQQIRIQFIQILTNLGLLISLVGFIYYTEFGPPHSTTSAVLLAGLGLTLWVLVYAVPFKDITTEIVINAYKFAIVGGAVFFGVHTWRYLTANLSLISVGEDTDTR